MKDKLHKKDWSLQSVRQVQSAPLAGWFWCFNVLQWERCAGIIFVIKASIIQTRRARVPRNGRPPGAKGRTVVDGRERDSVRFAVCLNEMTRGSRRRRLYAATKCNFSREFVGNNTLQSRRRSRHSLSTMFESFHSFASYPDPTYVCYPRLRNPSAAIRRDYPASGREYQEKGKVTIKVLRDNAISHVSPSLDHLFATMMVLYFFHQLIVTLRPFARFWISFSVLRA